MITLRHTIAPDLGSLSSCMEEITRALEDAGCAAEDVFAANLFIEEIVTNTLKYGFISCPAGPIDLVVEAGDDGVCVEVGDTGDPFNPFEQAAPDMTLPAAERPIGGLGIHLVKNLATECSYSRLGTRNVVRVKKKSS